MAGPGGMNVLPQYQGDYYQLQNQQALAQALMAQSMQSRAPMQTVGSGGSQNYQVMPSMSPLSGMSQLAEAYLGAKMGQNVAQGYRNLGQNQWSAFGGSNPAQAATQQETQPQPDPNQQALAQGAAQGSLGPTNANASLAARLAQQPAQPQPQAQPQQQPQQGPQGGATPMNPLGMNPAMAYSMYAADPGKYFETQAQAYKPADVVSAIRAAGIDPGSALGRQLAQQALAKANYIAPTSIRGQVYADAQGLHTLPAGAPEGYQNIQGPDGQWQTVPVQGGAGAVQGNAAANAIGKAYGQVMPAVDESGAPVYANQGVLAAGTAGGGQPGAPAGGFGANGGRFAAPSAAGAPGGVRPALSAADQAANTAAGTGAGKQYVADSSAANGYASRMFTLNKALTGLQGADTGPGGNSVQGMRSFLLAQAPQSIQQYLPGVDPNKISSYDEANKYLTQYAIGKAGALGEGTDSKLATTLSGNASTSISNLAAQDVVKANMGLERMGQAQVMEFNKTGLPPSKYQTWSAQWNKQIDPRAFVWDSMDASKRAAAAKTMSPQQRQAFTQQYNWALQNKFIDGPQGQ